MENSIFNSQGPIDAHQQQVCMSGLLPVGDALFVIGGKWKLKILIAMSAGHCRFNDLQRTLNGISAKSLSNDLKDLEENGFLVRKVVESTPVVVNYELTEYSSTLKTVITALAEWGTMHRSKILLR